jgi:putative nucleotidyltransferase with HDIG domain
MDVRLSEVIGALSHALDITEGQPRGHAERTCLIGMRLAEMLDMPAADRSSLFYALLLKDAGCSSNAAKVAELYGADDAQVKRDRKTTDHLQAAQSLKHLWRATSPGRPLEKASRLRALVRHGSGGSRALTALRCERGARIARLAGLGDITATAIRHLDEHWDGNGYPTGAAGEAISLGGRILCLAQTMEVFWQGGGPRAAIDVARERRGTWFDPALVDLAVRLEHDDAFWTELAAGEVGGHEPVDRVVFAGDDHLDRIAQAFAQVVDAKSPYTGQHSAGVTEIADGMAATLGMDATERRDLRRAALLHDIGKLGVSNRILDKPGKLDDAEWSAMRRHPDLTLSILTQVGAFADLAEVAANHHERLDGRGYGRGLTAEQLDLPSRLLAVADVAEALTAERPYRGAMPADDALAIMRRDAGTSLDACAFEACEAWLPTRQCDGEVAEQRFTKDATGAPEPAPHAMAPAPHVPAQAPPAR